MMYKATAIQYPSTKLSLLLQTRAIIERANAEIGMRADGNRIHQFNLVANAAGMFLANRGASIADDRQFTLTEDQAFADLAGMLAEMKKVRFCLPMLPTSKGVDNVAADIHQNVIIRIIHFYDIRYDEVLVRYDVVVEAID